MVGEQTRRRAVGRTADDDQPYRGLVGRTRSETAQVLMNDGTIRSLSVYTGIDAVADPGLAALARAGTLHQVGEGLDLALAYTYHDPDARVFLLVVPEGLRHRALMLRGEAMLAIAADADHAVPSYVRDVELVVGARGLARRLEAGSSPAPWLAPEEDHAARARALGERERELAQRARLLEARERAIVVPRKPPRLRTVHDSEVEELEESEEDALYAASVDDDDDEVTLGGGEPDEDVSAALEEVEELEADEAALDDGEDDEDEPPAFADSSVYVEALVAPPAAFTFDPSLQLWLCESAGRVWLFVRGRPGSHRVDAEMELLVQVEPTSTPPVVLISLVFDVDGTPEVRRGVIDPFVPEQNNALLLLAQHFEVELVSFSGQGIEHFATLHTPREGNVRAILTHLERHGTAVERGAWERARDLLLAAPLPWRDVSHPFQGDVVGAPLTATEAAVLLDELDEWLTPERRARVQLALSVPDELVDARYREGIGYALDWGLSLSRELAARALELGIAKDEAALLTRRIDGLCRTSREPDFGGLEPGVLRAEWSDALEQAARLGVGLSDEARELAQKHAGERALVHATALSDVRDASLDPARERAQAEPPDPAALEELASRGSYRDVLDACRLAYKLPPEQAGALFARVAQRIDPIALDALLSLLSVSEQLLVRVGAALALSSRRALNALDDLVAHVGREPDPEYRVFALALGRYGAGSFRAITQALTRHQVESERAALVHAHLALHGARAQVRAKARSHEPSEVELAERALALASELKDGKKPALGLEQQGALTVFCEMFDRLGRDAVG